MKKSKNLSLKLNKYIVHLFMSSRTIFLKNCPTEHKRGEKIVLLNVIAAKKN